MSPEALEEILEANFAPWVRDLNLTVMEATGTQVHVKLTPSERLDRVGGIVSGQALMAAADTVMVLAFASAAGELVPSATVDMNTSFLRPAKGGQPLVVRAELVRVGRTMGFARAEIQDAESRKLVATATGTYALFSS